MGSPGEDGDKGDSGPPGEKGFKGSRGETVSKILNSLEVLLTITKHKIYKDAVSKVTSYGLQDQGSISGRGRRRQGRQTLH